MDMESLESSACQETRGTRGTSLSGEGGGDREVQTTVTDTDLLHGEWCGDLFSPQDHGSVGQNLSQLVRVEAQQVGRPAQSCPGVENMDRTQSEPHRNIRSHHQNTVKTGEELLPDLEDT